MRTEHTVTASVFINELDTQSRACLTVNDFLQTEEYGSAGFHEMWIIWIELHTFLLCSCFFLLLVL